MRRIQFIIFAIIILFSSAMNGQCVVSATSSGGNAAYTQVYVLADASGIILDENSTGTFNLGVTTGTYQIHALNYDPANPPSPLPSGAIGASVNTIGSVTMGCFNADFTTDFITRVCTSCIQDNDVCINDDIMASTSGWNMSYTQVYVLADDSGNFVAQNSTGIFPSTSLTIGNTYQVHALNYDPSDPPSPLPSGLSVGDPLSNVTGGCFNADFLTDYVCFNIINCACTPTPVCSDSDIVATSSGGNSSYTQVYVLADEMGNFVAQNATGTFSAVALTVGDTYHVHALNYNPADPPSPLPSGLSVGDPLSDVTGGCFNADFLTDYVCFNIINCSCTPTTVCKEADIVATSSGGNSSYTQVYVLADDTGNFVAQNATGTFPAGILTVGNIYQVHALNYNPADAPSPLPSGLSVGDPLSDITGGCFNADFLTDYVCYQIDCCATGSGFVR